MNVIVTLESGSSEVKALLYAFPKRGNDLKGYSLTLAGVPATISRTGGGKYPEYVYIKIEGTSYYLPKNVIPVSGSDVKVAVAVAVAVEAAPVAVEAAPVEAAPAKKARKPK